MSVRLVLVAHVCKSGVFFGSGKRERKFSFSCNDEDFLPCLLPSSTSSTGSQPSGNIIQDTFLTLSPGWDKERRWRKERKKKLP